MNPYICQQSNVVTAYKLHQLDTYRHSAWTSKDMVVTPTSMCLNYFQLRKL